jgi:hypothetical protein
MPANARLAKADVRINANPGHDVRPRHRFALLKELGKFDSWVKFVIDKNTLKTVDWQ